VKQPSGSPFGHISSENDTFVRFASQHKLIKRATIIRAAA
jgi:hypothetical protein